MWCHYKSISGRDDHYQMLHEKMFIWVFLYCLPDIGMMVRVFVNGDCIIVTLMFHSFFNSLARSRYSSLFSYSFNFTLWSTGTAKSTILQVLSFLFIIIRCGHLAEIRWSVCMSKSKRSLCVSFSETDSGLSIYHLFVWSNFNFLHNSQLIILPTQSCLVLYSFCANLLHSLIM